MLDVAVLASGRGTNLQALLEAQDEGDLGPASVEIVLSDNEDAHALERARAHGVDARFVDPEGLDDVAYDRALLEHLDNVAPDLVVLAGYMRVLTPHFIQQFPDRVINIHPAILPSFKGLDAQRQALEAGVRVAGATTHFVTEDVDSGPIILQSAVPVHPDDDEDALSERILETEHRILPESVRLFAEGRLSVGDGQVEIKGQVDVPEEALIAPEVTT